MRCASLQYRNYNYQLNTERDKVLVVCADDTRGPYANPYLAALSGGFNVVRDCDISQVCIMHGNLSLARSRAVDTLRIQQLSIDETVWRRCCVLLRSIKRKYSVPIRRIRPATGLDFISPVRCTAVFTTIPRMPDVFLFAGKFIATPRFAIPRLPVNRDLAFQCSDEFRYLFRSMAAIATCR